jgi:hypothetical protein
MFPVEVIVAIMALWLVNLVCEARERRRRGQ